jgi:hypothetical protein
VYNFCLWTIWTLNGCTQLNKKYFDLFILNFNYFNMNFLIIKQKIFFFMHLYRFLRIYLRKNDSWGVSCGIYSRITCGFFAGKFPTDLLWFLVENSAGKFPADSKNRRNQLPTKVLAGNPNPQETCFLRIFCPNPQQNPQEISKFLVVI